LVCWTCKVYGIGLVAMFAFASISLVFRLAKPVGAL
jgi:hypothetical protein